MTMFADDIVLCSERREQVDYSLKSWRYALERGGMKVSRGKREQMCVSERETGVTVKMQRVEVVKVDALKYLATIRSVRQCTR